MTEYRDPANPLYKQDKPETQIIWRYLNFEYFVDLLSTRTLYFSRVDRVGDDPLEGRITDETFRALEREFEGVSWGSPAAKDVAMNNHKTLFKSAPFHFFVNCWHMNDRESMAMWKIYGKKGIAIESTIGNLKKSIRTGAIDYAEVQYITETDVIPTYNIKIPFGYKRKSFEYEEEFRAIRYEQPPVINDKIDLLVPNPQEFLRIPVDIDSLINRVYVFPYAKQGFYDCTKSVMEIYGLADKISQSNFTIGLSY
ncbi:hypothetical protein [Methanoregula sp.]|uniref:hypothetical protein n=1 Tax=Methanoregula sp. TaxID=2052170 RepID=UPI003C793059